MDTCSECSASDAMPACVRCQDPPRASETGFLSIERSSGPGPNFGLLRKFNKFWPAELPGPPDFPWLPTIVSRRKAWRWASQFPTFFEDVEYWDCTTIEQFISQTLTEVEPEMESSREKGDKKCCRTKDKPKPPISEDPDLPDDGICPDSQYVTCLNCSPGEGAVIWLYADCHEIRHPCGPQPDCPDNGPIDLGGGISDIVEKW